MKISRLLLSLLISSLLVLSLSSVSVAQVQVTQSLGSEFLDLGYNPATGTTRIVGRVGQIPTQTPMVFTPNGNSFSQAQFSPIAGETGQATVEKVSPNGELAAGFSPSSASPDFEGTAWLTSAPSQAMRIGFLPGIPGGSAALAAWNNGVAGHSGNGQRAITWTQATGIQELVDSGTNGTLSLPRDVNANGSIVVGLSSVDFRNGAAYFWDNTGRQRLDDNIENLTLVDSSANSISPNGQFIGGDITAQDINGSTRTFAVIWSGPSRDLVILRDAAGNFIEGSVNDISDTGYAVGTFLLLGNSTPSGFIWHPTNTNGAVQFENWLTSRQFNFSPRFESRIVTAIAEDTTTNTLRFTVIDENQSDSYYVEVDSSIAPIPTKFSLWNSFLGMWNILEVINNTNIAQEFEINTFNISGGLISTQTFTIQPGVQQDILVHDFQGIVPNSYGLITIDGAVTGRMLYYRPLNPQGDDFDFAFAIPLNSTPSTGTTGVGYNTFEPSSAPVSNWLSLVNLEDTQEILTVNRYSQQGELLDQREFTLQPRSRLDIDGGHQFPGRFNVGYLEIVPQNNQAQYLGQLIRYGIQLDGNIDFAFPLLSKSPSAGKLTAPANTVNNSDNWLEVINPNSFPINVDINFFNTNGVQRDINSQTIPPNAQIHYYINGQIGNNEIGSVDITSNSPMIINSMVYEGITGGQPLQTMYGLQAVPNTPSLFNNSYNLFLGMQNLLRINNLSDETITFTVDVTTIFDQAPGSTNSFSIAPRFSGDLNLNDFATFGTATNTYGSVAISTNNPNDIQAYVLRRHNGSNGNLDFAAPTLAQ